jgi:hypothetical protein
MQLSNWLERCMRIRALSAFWLFIFYPLKPLSQPETANTAQCNYATGMGEDCSGLDLQPSLHMDPCCPDALSPSFQMCARAVHVRGLDRPPGHVRLQ